MKRKIIQEKRYAYAANAHTFIHGTFKYVFDENRLRKAICLLHKINPVLNSLLVESENGYEYQEIPLLMPEILVVERANEKFYKKVIKEEERIPLNLHQNCSYRIILLVDETTTDFILMSHQMLLDAHSSLALFKAIIRAYEENGYKEFELDQIYPIDNLNKFNHLLLHQVLKSYRDDQKFFVEEEYRAQYLEYYRNHSTKLVHLDFDLQESSNICEYAKKHQIDPFMLLLTAFKASEDTIQHNRPNSFKTTLVLQNLRHKDAIGNYASLNYLDFIYNARHSLVGNTRHLTKQYQALDFADYFYLNSVLSFGCFKALEDRSNISFALHAFERKLGYWDNLIGSEYSFYEEVEEFTSLPLERLEVLRATHQLVEKNLSAIYYRGQFFTTLQYNGRKANRKDMHDIMANIGLILTDSIKE